MVKLTKIYTRTGDDGTTGLVDGSRVSKDSVLMAAIGDIDELNSCIGLAIAHLEAEESPQQTAICAELRRIQNDLFDFGADLATPADKDSADPFAPSEMVLRITGPQTDWLETRIDAMNEGLAPLASFILPGGSQSAAALHIARATARRAERAVVAANSKQAINPAAAHYVNRLSDYLFVLCRHVNAGGAGDIKWVPGASR